MLLASIISNYVYDYLIGKLGVSLDNAFQYIVIKFSKYVLTFDQMINFCTAKLGVNLYDPFSGIDNCPFINNDFQSFLTKYPAGDDVFSLYDPTVECNAASDDLSFISILKHQDYIDLQRYSKYPQFITSIFYMFALKVSKIDLHIEQLKCHTLEFNCGDLVMFLNYDVNTCSFGTYETFDYTKYLIQMLIIKQLYYYSVDSVDDKDIEMFQMLLIHKIYQKYTESYDVNELLNQFSDSVICSCVSSELLGIIKYKDQNKQLLDMCASEVPTIIKSMKQFISGN